MTNDDGAGTGVVAGEGFIGLLDYWIGGGVEGERES